MKNKKVAFTLAEVLITLGIIGVVAALTLPALIQKQNTKTVETRLKKVYSVMNQAIAQSETVNGPKEYWNFEDSEFINKYIVPYINKAEIKILNGSGYDYAAIYFADGSLLIVKISKYRDSEGNVIINGGMSQDWFFYPNAKNFDMTTFDNRSCVGRSCFPFRFAPNGDIHEQKKGFEPYKHSIGQEFIENTLRTDALYGCKDAGNTPMFCTALIQYNGWKIPDDYPFKVK